MSPSKTVFVSGERLDDGLPAHLADVWNGSGIVTGGMAAEVGFHAVDRQIQCSGRFSYTPALPVGVYGF